MPTSKCLSRVWVCLALSGLGTLLAQESATPAAPEPRAWTTEHEHRDMMAQLGIRKLRPGPGGNENAPNHANYDEALANPFPNLPDVLTLKDGRKVTTAQMWWDQRRPEIVEGFEREVFGRVPPNVPKVLWSVPEEAEGVVGTYPVVGRRLVGHVDNSSYPAIGVDIQMTLVAPKDAGGPVPVMMMFGFGGLPGASSSAAQAGRGFGPPPGGDPPATQQLIAGNFLKYGAAEADFGSKNAGDIPVGAHDLIALCAMAVLSTINKVNDNLAKFADGKKVRFLNINDKLGDSDGGLLDGVANPGDRLHLAVKGYQIWADALKPIFQELLGPPAKEDHAPPPTGDPIA